MIGAFLRNVHTPFLVRGTLRYIIAENDLDVTCILNLYESDVTP